MLESFVHQFSVEFGAAIGGAVAGVALYGAKESMGSSC
jgi:hypothetical protein